MMHLHRGGVTLMTLYMVDLWRHASFILVVFVVSPHMCGLWKQALFILVVILLSPTWVVYGDFPPFMYVGGSL